MEYTGPITDTSLYDLSGSIGPTGPVITGDIMTATGTAILPVSVGPTGPDPSILMMFPSAQTGPIEPPIIASMEELVKSYEATIVQETQDRAFMQAFLTPSRELFRAQLFQWAKTGFVDRYTVHSITLTPPTLCSDGVVRTFASYIDYCSDGKTMGHITETLASLMPGIQVSYSVSENTAHIYVSRS